MRSEEVTKSTLKIEFLAKISRLYRFSGTGNPTVKSDFIPEVVLGPFLRMRSKNYALAPAIINR
jgi:hypothetical protein